jgi:hypothetical protein
MRRIVPVVLLCLVVISIRSALAGDPVSPLFQARLEATMVEWERGATPQDRGDPEVGAWPASAHPASFCLGSACLSSYCIGSLCVSSECVGSGCVGSTCVGSGCASSLCAGSGCIGSICGGSACMGPSLCPRKCDGNDGATNPAEPDYGNLTYTWGPCREW